MLDDVMVRRLVHAAAVAALLAALAAPGHAAEPATAIPKNFADFQRDTSPQVAALVGWPAKKWVQIEPAVHALALRHAAALAPLDTPARVKTLAALAGFIDRRRAAAAENPVLAPGRTVIGLLDPDRGLDPKEITAIATAYGSTPTVFKKNAADETIAGVADAFLAAVGDAAAASTPATIIVLGHGLPTEIQSYSIRFERLTDALLAGAARRPAAAGTGEPKAIDLGHVVLICDDCFSADFLVNLLTAIETRCRDGGLTLASPPACIAGTNHGRVGFADFHEKFVPHFWKDVVELYFVRRPRPERIVLGNIFENVDHMMYGYGRAPIFDGGTVTGWRLVDPALVQDPVTFVPLDEPARSELRTILDLPVDSPIDSWLDVG
jgi:hypothetical protein